MEVVSLDDEGSNEGMNISNTVSTDMLDPEEKFIKEQRALLMREMLDKLNPKYRKLIQLRFFEELSYEEIAATLQLPLGTVKAQLFRAKELLYQVLKTVKDRY